MRSLFGSLNDPTSTGRSLFQSIRYPGTRDDEQSLKLAGGKKQNQVQKADRRKSASAQAEEGELGSLKEVYRELSEAWFDNMESSNVPAIFKMEMELTNMGCMNNALPDMKKIFSTILTDCKIKSFMSIFGKQKMFPFRCEAEDLKVHQKIPGRYPSYVVIGRNFSLWRKALGNFVLQTGQQTSPSTAKFPPYDATMKPEQSPRPQEHCIVMPTVSYIPRQQFILASVQGRVIKVWGYNISNDTARTLQGQLRQCVDFHNARQRALYCLTMQKLGIPRHCTFESGFAQTNTAVNHRNPFLKDVKDVDLVLLHSSLPSERDLQSLHKTKAAKRAFFNEAYLSNKPCVPLHLSNYGKESDVATQYAAQYMEMKNNLKRSGEEQQLLHRVFSIWRERPGTLSNASIKKDVMQVLLRHARLIHHVATPMLFNPMWRKLILQLKEGQEDQVFQLREAQPNKKQNRLSGNIRKSGDFSGRSVDDSKSRSRSNSARKENTKDKTVKTVPQLSQSESIEECKYDADELKRALMMHYIQYWQSMHFILVKEEKSGRNEKSSRKTNSKEKDAVRYRRPTQDPALSKTQGKDEQNQSMFLYRAASGGIVIVEICCVSMNFLVKLYTLEASRLQHQANINQQMTVLFLNVCEHLKDYTHAHSFSFDFHLRYVQWYIQDRQTAIKPGYNLVSLLSDFISYYRTPPLFVFNHIQCGTVEAPCSHVTPEELYEYIVGKQAVRHGFKTLKLTDNEVERNEHALVSAHLVCSQFHTAFCNKEEHDMYDVCYVVSLDSSERRRSIDSNDSKSMKLKFFVIFTNRRNFFPRFDLHDNPNPLQTSARSRPLLPKRSQQNSLASQKVSSEQPGDRSAPSHMKSNSMSLLIQEDQIPPTSGSISTSALQKLHAQAATTDAASLVTSDSLRKKDSEERTKPKKDSNKFIKSSSPTYSDVGDAIAPQGFDKKRLISQGRRQSMPNFAVTLSGGKLQQVVTPNRQASIRKRLQNSASRTIQGATERLGVAPTQQDSGLQAFIRCEINRLEEFLLSISKSAEIQCYRNKLWDKVYMDRSTKSSMLTVHDFEHLLKHCQQIPLSKFDPRGVALGDVKVMGVQWGLSLQKHMMGRLTQMCRMFTNQEATRRYLGVLNPKLYSMMLLITVDTVTKEIGMFAVMRDKQEELDKEEPDLTNGNPNLIPLCGHIKNMIDFMVYHTWTLLPT